MTKQSLLKKKEEKRKFSKDMPDFILIVVVLLLLGIGLIMVLSASNPSAQNAYSDPTYYFKAQAKFAVIGLVLAYITSKINYRWYKMFCWTSYFLSLALLLLVMFAGTGAKGAVRWLNIGGIQFQPSELVKVLVINFNASYIIRNIREIKKANKMVLGLHLVCLVSILALLYFQPHYSAMIIVVIFSFLMFFSGGYNITHLLVISIIGIVVVSALLFAQDYRKDRFVTFLNPFEKTSDDSYQIFQSLYAIGSGGLFGVGLGNSRQKYSYLPEQYNDFIFSIIAEELGFVGCMFIIGLYIIFILRGYTIAARCDDLYGALLAIGITTMFAIQIMFNIAVTISLMPVTGISLPFMSYGGTALLIQLLSVGILLNISRASASKFIKPEDEKKVLENVEQNEDDKQVEKNKKLKDKKSKKKREKVQKKKQG